MNSLYLFNFETKPHFDAGMINETAIDEDPQEPEK
jgi:hypothetical protein